MRNGKKGLHLAFCPPHEEQNERRSQRHTEKTIKKPAPNLKAIALYYSIDEAYVIKV